MEFNHLQIGDLVACKMSAGIKNVTHRGIYVGEIIGIGKHTVVHNFCSDDTKSHKPNLRDWPKMMFNLKTGGGIVVWTMEDFRDSGNDKKWWIDNMEELFGKSNFRGEKVAERARNEARKFLKLI
uniref:Uncharacterized protein n=1 Tax=Meloidogyne enterolobii TaxID=390850 RepID=A0A6V7WVG7_MELEN|nr:unnamed protein product [Meloidogyne enterolobii]